MRQCSQVQNSPSPSQSSSPPCTSRSPRRKALFLLVPYLAPKAQATRRDAIPMIQHVSVSTPRSSEPRLLACRRAVAPLMLKQRQRTGPYCAAGRRDQEVHRPLPVMAHPPPRCPLTAHPPPRTQARCPLMAHPPRHHPACLATQREHPTRARQLLAQTHMDMVPAPLARQASHTEVVHRVGPARPRQIWRRLCPRTLPLWWQAGLALWSLSLCNVTSPLLLVQFSWTYGPLMK